MTYEQIRERIKNGQNFLIFKYKGMFTTMEWGHPNADYFKLQNHNKFTENDLCFNIEMVNQGTPYYVKAWMKIEELSEELFDKWVERIQSKK